MNKRVLILCTGNSCRSQMAEGLWRSIGAGVWKAYSAGSKPAGFVHPLAVEVMGEMEIDISRQASKHVNQFAGQGFDLLVTVCDGVKEVCPTLPGAKQLLHWPFYDPAAAAGSDQEKLTVFRRVRDEISRAIHAYLKGTS